MTNEASTGTLVFDFGSVFSIENTQIWNYGPGCCGNERSTKDMVIESSVDGINYDIIGSYVLSQPITDPFGSDTVGLGGLNARFIKFDLNSTYGPSQYIGLSEVQFFGSEPNGAPEPATLALMGLGLAGLGAMSRRKF